MLLDRIFTSSSPPPSPPNKQKASPVVATADEEMAQESLQNPFLDSFVRAFLLGVGAGGLCEVGHVGLKVGCRDQRRGKLPSRQLFFCPHSPLNARTPQQKTKQFLGLALSSHANLFESLDQFSPLIVLDHVAAV